MKSGMYDFEGNTVIYYSGDDYGEDIDSGDDIPVDVLAMLGLYVASIATYHERYE